MSADIDATAKRSAEIENAVESIEHGKQLLIDLDRRLNMNREGSRALRQQSSKKKIWVLCPGGVFVQGSKDAVLAHLDSDTNETRRRVEVTRDELKVRVVELAHLEGPDSALQRLNMGFELKPV